MSPPSTIEYPSDFSILRKKLQEETKKKKDLLKKEIQYCLPTNLSKTYYSLLLSKKPIELRKKIEKIKFKIIEDFVSKSEFQDGSKVTIDGLRVDFNDGWGLIRASNTTPKLVLRFEANSPSRLQEIKNMFLNQLQLIDESIHIDIS